MIQKLKKLKIFPVLFILALLSAGCGGGGGGGGTGLKPELTVWMPYEDSQSFQVLMDGFSKKNKNVRIDFFKKDPANYEQELINALAAGKGPDIFAIHNSWLPKYLDKIKPLDSASFDKNFNLATYKRDFVDSVVNDFVFQEKIYGTALSVDSMALYYNKDILGSAGIATPARTWNELAAHSQKIRRQNAAGYFTQSGVALGTSKNVNRSADILEMFMLQKGAVAFSEDKLRPVFANRVGGGEQNPGQAAFDFYTSFALPYSMNYTWNSKSDDSIDAFASGKLAYVFGYSYLRDTLALKNPNLNYDAAPVPQADMEKPSVTFPNYWGLVVSNQSKFSDWAWEFLKYASSKEALDKYYSQNKVPSSRKDLIDLQILDPEIGVFAAGNLVAKNFYKPDQAKVDAIFMDMIDAVILRGSSVEDALSEAEERVGALVRR